ncbi:MAG: MATE family efflux transporter [Clostridia bacterium]
MEVINKAPMENKMGTKPVAGLLIKMSLPIMLSMFVMALYNIVDSIFVAQVSSEALTGVSLAFPFQMILIGVGVGTGIGVNSLISRSLGEKNQLRANNTASIGIILALLSGLLFSLLYFFLSEPLMRIFISDDLILPQATSYLRICGTFCTFSMIGIMMEKIIQGTGSMIPPMVIQLAGAVTNIILDPILIFGYFGITPMGVDGAAIATVIGQGFSMLVAILFLRKDKQISIGFRGLKIDWSIIKGIYSVAMASIVMQCIGSFTTFALNAILMVFTPVAVNVLGIYFKIQSFVFMPIFGLNSGALPIMAYNYGAKNKKRFKDTLKYGIIIAVSIMIVGVLVFQFFPGTLLSLFNADKVMLDMGTRALRIISICFPFAAVGIMLVTMFNALGKGIYSLIVSAARQLLVIVPAALILANTVGLDGVWFAYPIAEIVGMVLSAIFFKITYKKYIANM